MLQPPMPHGFVQTINQITLGTSFVHGVSTITYDDAPYIVMSIHRAPGQQQWWVTVNDTPSGYFPRILDPVSDLLP